MIYFPESLPCPQYGLEFAPKNPQLNTPMDSGREVVRRYFTAVPVDFNAQWALSSQQAVTFEEFYKNDLEDGAKWFEIKIPVPQQDVDHLTVRFVGIYKNKMLAPNLWEYKAKMQAFLRPTKNREADCFCTIWQELDW